MPASLTVSEIIERHGFSRPVVTIIGLCFLLLVCDSYDVAALSFAAPVLMKSWQLSPHAMGLVFSVGLFGLLVGSLLFGGLGDRIGRKRAMVLGALAFSVLTGMTGFSASYEQLLALRFLAALGLGGAVPNAVALASEFAPRTLRVTAVGAIFAGYSVGGILAGLSAARIVPAYGWEMLFFAGGVLSLLMTAVFGLLLPESLRYLAGRPSRQAEASRVAVFLRPELVAGGAKIVPDREDVGGAGKLAELFAGRLALVTPLMWLVYIASSMTVFSLTSWMPVAVEALGLSRGAAAVATSLLFAGSAVGGVAAGRLADRFGFGAIVAVAVCAFVVVSAIGSLGGTPGLLFPISFLAGFFTLGGQSALHGVVGTLYPTPTRANGIGWANGIAKIGSIAGPYIAGVLLPELTTPQLFLAAATPLLAVAVLSAVLRATLVRAATGVTPLATGSLG